MNKISYFIVFLGILFCSSCRNENSTCKWDSITTFYSEIYTHGRDTSFANYVILKRYPMRCRDSLNIPKLIKQYIDTLSNKKIKKDLDYIWFYNSNKNLNLGGGIGMGDGWGDGSKNFLFKVSLDKKSKKILHIWYNRWGT